MAYRFGVSLGAVSKYFITWISLLYCHFSEVDWMPAVKQVKGTLPHAFQEKYPRTYMIIDATEIFLDTPTNLQVQSCTWSNYKHHNTAKLLVGCIPNGAISFISSAYVGSISNVELTQVFAFMLKGL